MIRISNEKVTLHIDELGFIRRWEYGETAIERPSYLVFFKDYSRLDPLCRHWDMNQHVDNIRIDSTSIKYEKQIEDIKICSKITITSNGWDWQVEIPGSYPLAHRLGIAVTCLPGNLKTIDKTINTDISQYCRSSREIFPDQTFLDLPLIFHESDSLFVIFSNINTDCQFFRYNDKATFNRVTTTTSLTNAIIISVRICKTIEEAKLNYLKFYPKADVYINKWKPMLQNLKNIQEIEITYAPGKEVLRLETPQNEIKMQPIDELNIDAYIQLVHEELKKYPSGFLRESGVDGILLCGNISVRRLDSEHKNRIHIINGIIIGLSNRVMSWILWDVTKCERWIIHHEIFHFFANKIHLIPGGSSLFTLSTLDLEEHAADLFALMMTDKNRLKQISTSWHVSQMEMIKQQMKCLFEEKRQPVDDTRFIWMIDKGTVTKVPFGEMPEVRGSSFRFVSNLDNK